MRISHKSPKLETTIPVHDYKRFIYVCLSLFGFQDPLTEQEIIDALPVKDMTLDIIIVTKILSDRGTNALGDFEVQYMYDPRGTKPVEK